MKITQPTVLIPAKPDGTTGAALTAKPTATGFVAVDLGPDADPIAMTPEILAGERAGLPGWRFQKEYCRNFGAQAGMPVFEQSWLDALAPGIVDAPLHMSWSSITGTVTHDPDGDIRVWKRPDTPLEALSGVSGLRYRPCGIGIDVGEGVGASDSTIQVFFADNREQAAEYASNVVKPTDLGRIAVALARHYNSATICCVRKMHGITTLRAIMDDCGYRQVWRAKTNDRIVEQDTSSYGWPGGEASSPYLFGTWMDAIQHKQTILHSQTCLDQHRQYIYDPNGRITHQSLANLPPEVRERHGDLVIGCALAYRACLDACGATIEQGRARPEVESWG